jgi:branched-chain amino acid transport system substrate-binding protein
MPAARGAHMKLKSILSVVAVAAALATFAAACSSSSKGSTPSSSSAGSGAAASSTGSSSAGSSSASSEFVSLGGWNDPACDSSKPKVDVGISEPINVPGTSLKDYVDGTQAAVDAFNKRGGILGQCLVLKVCDGMGDAAMELSCARGEVADSNMVAGLASTYEANEAGAYQLFQSAGLAQVGSQVTQPAAWNSPVSYEFTMGGSGTLLAGMPALKDVGVTKFVVFVPESGQIGALAAFAAPLVKALGMDLVDTIQIPPTAVDFSQYVIKAQNDGAQGGVLGLPGNVGGQIIDAADSLNSTLKLSSSWGTFSQQGVVALPQSIAKNMAFTDAVPPAVENSSRWPIFNVILDDFKASGKPNLTPSTTTAEATNGWLAVYALIKVMRDAHATSITRATVKQAFDAATNVPMFGLVPPWTPTAQTTNAIFKGIHNPEYWTGHWDAASKQFDVDSSQVNIISLLG